MSDGRTRMYVDRLWPRRATKLRAGFTLVEVTLSMIIFLLMVLVFAAVFPFAIRTAQFSNNYSQAALLAQHKLDQLQTAGYSRLDYSDLSGLGIIDSAQQTSPYTFTGVDNLVGSGSGQGFFPPGSSGIISIVDYHTVNPSMAAGQMDYVTVTITWTTYTGEVGTYSASSVM